MKEMTLFLYLLFVFIVHCESVGNDNLMTVEQTQVSAVVTDEALSLLRKFNFFATRTTIPSNDQRQMFEQLVESAHEFGRILTRYRALFNAAKLELTSIVRTYTTIYGVSATFLINRDTKSFDPMKLYKVQLESLNSHIESLEEYKTKFEELYDEWTEASKGWKPNFFLAEEDEKLQLEQLEELEKNIDKLKRKQDEQLNELHKAKEEVSYLEEQLKQIDDYIGSLQEDKIVTEKTIKKLQETLQIVQNNEREEIALIKSTYNDPHEKYLQELIEDYHNKTKFIKSRRDVLQKEWMAKEVSKDKPTNYYFICDKSGSMSNDWKYLKKAYKLFINQNRGVSGKVYVIVFSDAASIYIDGEKISDTSDDFESWLDVVKDKVKKFVGWGGTDFGPPFKKLSSILADKNPENERAIVFFITDGEGPILEAQTISNSLHTRWKENLKLFAIGLGGSGSSSLKTIAESANGCTSIYDSNNNKLLDYVKHLESDVDMEAQLSPIFLSIQQSTYSFTEKLKENLLKLDDLLKQEDKLFAEEMERIKKQPDIVNEGVLRITNAKVQAIKNKYDIVKKQTQQNIDENNERTIKLGEILTKSKSEKKDMTKNRGSQDGRISTLTMELKQTENILKSSFDRYANLNHKMQLPPEQPEGWKVSGEEVRKIYQYIHELTEEKVKVDESLVSISKQVSIISRSLLTHKNQLVNLKIEDLKVSDVDAVLKEFYRNAPPEVQEKCGKLVSGEQLIVLFEWYFNIKPNSLQSEALHNLEEYVGLSAILKMNLGEDIIIARLKEGISVPVDDAQLQVDRYIDRKQDPRCASIPSEIKLAREEIAKTDKALENCDLCEKEEINELRQNKKNHKEQIIKLKEQFDEIRYTVCKTSNDEQLQKLQEILSDAQLKQKKIISSAKGLIQKMKESLLSGGDHVRRKQLFNDMNFVITNSRTQIKHPIQALIKPNTPFTVFQKEIDEDMKRLAYTKEANEKEENASFTK